MKTEQELQLEIINLREELRLLKKSKKIYKNAKRRVFGLKTRLCIHCHKEVARRHFRCPFCTHFTTVAVAEKYRDKIESERNKEIVTKMKTGEYTLAQLGEEYEVSRERIRQIYKKIVGTPSTHHSAVIHQKRKEAKEAHAKEIKMNCKGCLKPVTYAEGSRRHKYCDACHEIFNEKRRDPDVTQICYNCKNPFHPHDNVDYPSQNRSRGIFCTNRCYFDVIHTRKMLRDYYTGNEELMY